MVGGFWRGLLRCNALKLVRVEWQQLAELRANFC